MCYKEINAYFFDVMKFFLQKFVNFNMTTYSFLVEKLGNYRRTPMPKYDFNKVAKQLY